MCALSYIVHTLLYMSVVQLPTYDFSARGTSGQSVSCSETRYLHHRTHVCVFFIHHDETRSVGHILYTQMWGSSTRNIERWYTLISQVSNDFMSI